MGVEIGCRLPPITASRAHGGKSLGGAQAEGLGGLGLGARMQTAGGHEGEGTQAEDMRK